ncbi:MAG: polyketide synthase dehydratase domain-containing protein, partial [Anaerolineales bacterium]|nr:polyketide synthase dehydratase domain-containing protein [Anaerolineales bacterium]
ALGIMVAEFDETGGLDVEKANVWLKETLGDMLMIGEIKAAKLYGGLEVETTLDPNVQPFLYDHAMDGTPLLPGVMGTETFSELALTLAPGFVIADIANEQFEAPFKFYRMEPQTLYLNMFARPMEDCTLVAYGQIKSKRELAKPGLAPQEKTHFTVEVHLTQEPLDMPSAAFEPPAAEALAIPAEDIYKVYFHGPAYQVLESVQANAHSAIGLVADDMPPSMEPSHTASVMAPRLIEACFQTAGVWDIEVNGRMALPLAIGSVNTYRQMEEAESRLYAVVQVIEDGAAFNGQVVDESGNVYVTLNGYRTVALPGKVSF